jgi:UrcA family protein
MKNHVFAAAVAIAAMTVPALATAAPARADDDSLAVTVSYRDLNLDTPAGQKILRARLERAAEDICGRQPDTLADVAANQRFNVCMKKTMTQALAMIPAPTTVAGSSRPNG